MKWDKEIPTKDGYYWRRQDCGCIDMVTVYKWLGKDKLTYKDDMSDKHMNMDSLEGFDHEFYGPIYPPEFEEGNDNE